MDKFRQIFKRYSQTSLFRDSLIVFIGSMAANVAAYLYHLFVGRILGPIQFGELIALLSLLNIFNVPSTVLQTVLVKYFSILHAKNEHGEIKSLFWKLQKNVVIIEVVLLVLILPLIPFTAKFLQIKNQPYFIWLYLVFATYLISTINGSLIQAIQAFKASSIITSAGSVLRLIFGIIAAPFGVGLTLISNVLSNFITYLIAFIPLKYLNSFREKPLSISKRDIFNYSLPTLIATYGMVLMYSQDVVLVKHFFSPINAGIYSSLSVLGKIVFFATSAVGFVIFPKIALYREQGRNYLKIIILSLILIAVISFGITAIYAVVPGLVVNLLFGKSFIQAVPYMGLFGLFVSFYSLSNILVLVYLAASKTIVWINVITAAILQTVLLNIFHSSINQVIYVNLLVTISLFVSLLVYLSHAKKLS